MSEIERIPDLEKTIKYCIEHFDKLDIDDANMENLGKALEYSKNKVISNIVATSLNNKPEIKRQISETLVHLNNKQKENEENRSKIQKKAQDIKEKMQKIEKSKKMVIEPGVRIEFQKRKHEKDLKELEEDLKNYEQELKELEQKNKIVQGDIARVNGIIKNFKNPENLVKKLIERVPQAKIDASIYDCIKRLESNGMDVGLQLTKKYNEKELLNKENIEILAEIAINPTLIEELKKFKDQKQQISEEYSTSKEEVLIEKNERKMDIRFDINEDAGCYMETILRLYDSALESFMLKQEDKEEGLDSINNIKQAFLKILKKDKYEEYMKKIEEKEKKDLTRKNKMEELKNSIKEYSDLCNKNPEIRKKIRDIWQIKILKENNYSNSGNTLDNSTREEYSEMAEHEELNFLLNYLNKCEDRDKAASDLVKYAKKFTRKDIRSCSKELNNLQISIKQKKEEEEKKIKQIKDNCSDKVKNALEKGLNPDKIENLELFDKFESKSNVKPNIVPAVDLLILYTLLKEEKIDSIQKFNHAGYKIDLKKIEREINKGMNIITNALEKCEKKADGREV